MTDSQEVYIIMLIPVALALTYLSIPPRFDPVIRLKEWLLGKRGRAPNGEQYVEFTPQGRLYKRMQKRCPACGFRPPVYMEGPKGGVSTNIFCGCCGQGYNVTPMVEMAEEIHKDKRYILPEFKK